MKWNCQLGPRQGILFCSCYVILAGIAQADDAELRQFLLGKQVTVKIDMPATQKGIDLQLDKAEPMNWSQYSDRLKQYGVALRQGEQVTVTSIVAKKDTIEVQLNGGGFGTFRDNSATAETSSSIPVTRTEARLQKEVKNEKDPERRKKLERSLDREKSSRESEQARRDAEAHAVTELRRQELRPQGGSRFNLRWNTSIEKLNLTPEVVMRRLQPYVAFDGVTPSDAPSPPRNPEDSSSLGNPP